jgi:hypothetical protein
MRLLITISDIAQYRDVTTHVKDKRVDPMIREAQEIDLRNLLGETLYDKVVEDISPLNYPELDAVINPAMCYWAYARLLKNNRITITSNGVVNKNVDGSVQAVDQAIAIALSDARDVAKNYANRIVKFLDDNSTDYPEWKCKGNGARGSIRITAVGDSKSINDAVKDDVNRNSLYGNRGLGYTD